MDARTAEYTAVAGNVGVAQAGQIAENANTAVAAVCVYVDHSCSTCYSRCNCTQRHAAPADAGKTTKHA